MELSSQALECSCLHFWMTHVFWAVFRGVSLHHRASSDEEVSHIQHKSAADRQNRLDRYSLLQNPPVSRLITPQRQHDSWNQMHFIYQIVWELVWKLRPMRPAACGQLFYFEQQCVAQLWQRKGEFMQVYHARNVSVSAEEAAVITESVYTSSSSSWTFLGLFTWLAFHSGFKGNKSFWKSSFHICVFSWKHLYKEASEQRVLYRTESVQRCSSCSGQGTQLGKRHFLWRRNIQ